MEKSINFIEAIKRGQQILREQSVNITPKEGTSLISIRKLIDNMGKIASGHRMETEKKIAYNNDQLSARLASEANSKLREEHRQYVDGLKAVATQKLNEAIEAKKDAVKRFSSVPPTDKQLRLFQTAQMLDYKLRDYEWRILIDETATNYLASRILAKVADGQKNDEGKPLEIIPAFNPERVLDNLDIYASMAKKAIDALDDLDSSLLGKSFVADSRPNDGINKIIDNIESSFGAVVPAEKMSILKRLRDAKDNAFNNATSDNPEGISISSKIRMFIDQHERELATPEELQESLMNEAESLIASGMSIRKKSDNG